MKGAPRWLLQTVVPPLLLFVGMVALWHMVVAAFDIQKYLLPRPGQVAQAAWENRARLLSATWLTAQEAIAGFLLSLLIGTLIALLFSQSGVIRRSAYPYAIFLQTVPIVAIAPLIVIWLGFGFVSVMVIAFIISLFPIIANATAGLTTVDPGLRELFQLNSATRWQVLWKLQFPGCVPSLITGARTSCGLAVVGAIVGEFFAGYSSQEFGLGYLIFQTNQQLKTDLLFASILASTALGVAMFSAVSLAGAKILTRWYDAPQS